MARWTTFDGVSPWTLYHSALGFECNRTGERALVDFGPQVYNSVWMLIYPDVRPAWDSTLGRFYTWATGHASVRHQNVAWVAAHRNWPARFQTFTRVGRVTGAQFYTYLDWVRLSFVPQHQFFDVLEVLSVVDPPHKALASNMCHDFVADSLNHFASQGASRFGLPDGEFLARDHIMLFSHGLTEVAEPMSWRDRRALLRYLRLAAAWSERIKHEFGYVRTFLEICRHLRIRPWITNRGRYFKVDLTSPSINYCYLILSVPPTPENYFTTEDKKCALELDIDGSPPALAWSERAAALEEWADGHAYSLGIVLLLLFALVVSSLRRCCWFSSKRQPSMGGQDRGKGNLRAKKRM
eukprot:TRINITY_DN49098_c0_g1_i1.p1 TRINITY_DN49098_c0_g1~~TRINITY_DN49098_c0_g1_i1.p1  ORF type:complete len:412 (+),score=42.72 TRINITY_DN49098_c0_g1_i1:179-1237(+)